MIAFKVLIWWIGLYISKKQAQGISRFDKLSRDDIAFLGFKLPR